MPKAPKTKKNQRPSAYRNWPFTSFKDLDWEAISKHPDIQYLVVGEEVCPDTQRTHWQGYIQFLRTAKTMAQVKNILGEPTVHLEPQWAEDCESPADYCKKDNKYVQFGTLKQQGTRTDLQAVKDMIDKEGLSLKEIRDIVPYALFCQYRRAFQDHIDTRRDLTPRAWYPDVQIFSGPPFSGKNHAAIVEQGGVISTYTGQFFDRISEHMVFDEFHPNKIGRNFLLQLLDKWDINVQTKGGWTVFNPRKITLITNDDPKTWDIWSDSAFTRRVTRIVYFDGPPEESVPKPAEVRVPYVPR